MFSRAIRMTIRHVPGLRRFITKSNSLNGGKNVVPTTMQQEEIAELHAMSMKHAQTFPVPKREPLTIKVRKGFESPLLPSEEEIQILSQAACKHSQKN